MLNLKNFAPFTAAVLWAGLWLSNIAHAQSTPLIQNNQIKAQSNIAKALSDGLYLEIETDHAIGAVTAPITMIVYASVTCPHCAHWFTGVWPYIKANYVETGKVRVVFREMITAPPQLAYLGFQLANCAPKDQYFSHIEHQMKEQEKILQSVQDGKGKATYLALAKLAGANTETEMNACFDNQDGRTQIARSMKLATDGKINGVPGFIVNGDIYKESHDYLPLSKHFESLLGQNYSPMPKP